MTALQSPLATIIQNIYIEKSENYLNNKNYDVTTFVKDQATGELHVKIQILYNQLASFLTNLSTQNVQTSTSILSEDKKHLFPKTPGKIADIIKNKPKLQSFASEIMTFLRKYHLGEAKMIGQRAALVRLYFPVESLGQKRRNTFCVTQHFIPNTHALLLLLPSPFPYFIFPKQMWRKCLN